MAQPVGRRRITVVVERIVVAYLARYRLLIPYPIQRMLDDLAGAPANPARVGTVEREKDWR